MTEKIQQIPLGELHAFQNHPFQVKDNEELRELAKSIREDGVLSPAIARPRREGGYELISGHRRKAACEIAGVAAMPVIVRELDDNEATIVMVDSNQQREHLLPSEKAFAYKMKLDALKRIAGRPSKNNLTRVAANFRSDDAAAKETGISGDNLRRYIRLTHLIEPILKMVDEKQIAFNPAAELSYLSKGNQATLKEAMEIQQCTPSLSQAQRMKKLSQKGELNADQIFKILSEAKANQKEKICFSIDRIKAYFPPGYTPRQMERSILGLLEERMKRFKQPVED